MCKEVAMAYFLILYWHLSGGTAVNYSNNWERVLGLWAEIWILDLLDVKEECYQLTFHIGKEPY